MEFIIILAALGAALILIALFLHARQSSKPVPFDVAMENLRAEIGKELTPALKKVLDAIQNLIEGGKP